MSKLRQYYAKKYEKSVVDENLVLYETRDGQSITDSPLAIFIQLCRDERFSQLKHVWVTIDDSDEVKEMIPADCKDRVSFVVRNSKEYATCLLTAKYLLNNATFQSFFIKKKEQIYINTWHGTPLKYMGFDIPGNPKHSENVVRNLLMTDYFISPNDHTTEIFANSYKLRGIYPGKILEFGYPRNDFTINLDKQQVFDRLSKDDIYLELKKPVVLYTPTWKGTSIQNPVTNIEQTVQEALYLKEKISDTYQLLIKVHPYVYPFIKDRKELKGFLIPDSYDANQILRITDILITDYSSIFFDYLVTEKPIIFYAWDKDLYDNERGMYLLEKDLPGPVVESIEDVARSIEHIESVSDDYRQKYIEAKQKFVPYDFGDTAQKCIDFIFAKQQISSDRGKIVNLNSNKLKLLIYPGNLASNGITSSFINLMDSIDHDKIDVTVFTEPNKTDGIKNIAKLNKNVRLLFKPGAAIYTLNEDFRNRQIQEFTLGKDKRDKYPEIAFKRESNRLLANLEFDTAIDFSGYSYFWAKLILGASAKKHIVYQHNDLWTDSKKVVKGKMPHVKALPALFSIYFKFDRILSVSTATMKINSDNLKQFVDEKQMGTSINTINVKKILTEKKEMTQITDSKDNLFIPERIDQLLTIRHTSDQLFFKTMYDINDPNKSFSKTLIPSQIITAIAKLEVNQQIYYKCLVDQIYTGWVLADDLIVMMNKVQNIKKCHIVATMLSKTDRFIWSDLEDVFRSGRITETVHLKNTYVFCDKIAKTSYGTFYHLKNQNKVTGWVEENLLARIHDVSELSPLNFYFTWKNNRKVIGVTQKHYVLNQIVKVKQSFFTKKKGWTYPPGTTLSSEKNLPIEPGKIYEARAKAVVNEQVFYQVTDSTGNLLGWIDEKFIEPVTQFTKEVVSDTRNTISEHSEKNQTITNFDSTYFNLVSMGRLSPEKNYENLLKGFAKFIAEKKDARLYILGKGLLEEDLQKQIESLHLQDFVFLLGHIDSPFDFVRENDVFILPSVYEGQPMVLLEAMTLGMKILATNIPANIGVLGMNEEYGLLTNGTDPKALYEGIKRIYAFQGSFKTFDYKKYNEQAVDKFYQEIKN